MFSGDLISIIVPVYNTEQFLPRCLACIERQTYRNLEIILVDDGSTDRSGAICDEFARKDPRARVIHQENQGLWAARNAGQRVAMGDFLIFPDSDDYFHADMLRLRCTRQSTVRKESPGKKRGPYVCRASKE